MSVATPAFYESAYSLFNPFTCSLLLSLILIATPPEKLSAVLQGYKYHFNQLLHP
jgi:hypothetical protein